jgi:HlyD family secretion protein
MTQLNPIPKCNSILQRAWITVATVVVVTSLVIAAWWWQREEQAKAIQPEYTTTTVRRGNLTHTITGTGNLEAASLSDLAFSLAGTVAEINVQVGDEVKQGQVLAVLAGQEELLLEVETQVLAVSTAEKNLEAMLSSGNRMLAEAQVELSAYEAIYEEARANLHQDGDARCSKSLTEDYFYEYLAAKLAADEWQNFFDDGSGYGTDYVLEHLNPLLENKYQAYLNWTYCEGYTEQEILESEATLSLAEAAFNLAETNYQNLLTNSGISHDSLQLAYTELEKAQKKLLVAQEKLAGATLTAPMDAVVTSIAANEGETVGTNVFIQLADLYHPVVNIQMDEVDLLNISTGCEADIQFDAVPERSFSGEVVQISPALVSVFNFDTIAGLLEMQDQSIASGRLLPSGLSALVDLHCKSAEDILYVTIEAIRYSANNEPYVYILNDLGKVEKRMVTTGLETITSVEITSGLKEGEQVITSEIDEIVEEGSF